MRRSPLSTLTGRRRAGGSALVVSVAVSALVTALGLGYLVLAGNEGKIAASDRDTAQLLQTAESGLRMVKAWFDQPVTGDPSAPPGPMHRFLGLYDLRDPSLFDRSRRLLDDDGDPATPRVPADGSPARPYYRQGRALWSPSPFLDLFHKPYTGDLTTRFAGTADGPDLLLEERPDVVDFLDLLNHALFTRQEETGRIVKIALFAPPLVPVGGVPRPAGFCTVEVTVAKFSRLGRSGLIPVVRSGTRKLAEMKARMVLGEVPGMRASGPLESCGALDAGGGLGAHWGRVIAAGDLTLPSDLDAAVPSAFPYRSFARHISGQAPGDDYYEWIHDPATELEDPWLKIIASGTIAGYAGLPGQPFPYDQNAPIDTDHSNLFQRVIDVDCGRMRYGPFKAAASSGAAHARYFAFDPPTGLFRESGRGVARSVRDWTDGEEGLFFFDTRDGAIPNGHGPGDPATNLTPAVTIANAAWSFSGLLYLNAESIAIRDVTGASRVILPPGEPYDDANANGRHDPGEAFVNLRYPTSLVSGSPASVIEKDPTAVQSATATTPDLETYSAATTTGRDAQGVPFAAEVNLFGVLYNAGEIDASGAARHFGSLLSGTGVVQSDPAAGAPEIYFDERLDRGTWPPAEISFPRTSVILWRAPF